MAKRKKKVKKIAKLEELTGKRVTLYNGGTGTIINETRQVVEIREDNKDFDYYFCISRKQARDLLKG
jgi:ABC-type amino acid transport substrate-binding protein